MKTNILNKLGLAGILFLSSGCGWEKNPDFQKKPDRDVRLVFELQTSGEERFGRIFGYDTDNNLGNGAEEYVLISAPWKEKMRLGYSSPQTIENTPMPSQYWAHFVKPPIAATDAAFQTSKTKVLTEEQVRTLDAVVQLSYSLQ